MQNQSLDSKKQSLDIDPKDVRSPSVNLPNENQTTGPKSPWPFAAKTSLINTHTGIKRHDVLSAIPLENHDDLLKIRALKEPRKAISRCSTESSIITINVSGARFQTHLSTLETHPDTLLGDANRRKLYWNSDTEEYFFDRHRSCFEAILYYYQSNGRLRRPVFVPIDTFLEEISFFQLGEKASADVHREENVSEVKQNPMPRQLWRKYIWFYLEYPQHSAVARAINIISTLFTILSCVALAVESLPQYTDHWNDICKLEANLSTNTSYVPRCPALFYSPFFIIQTICVAFFTVEFLLRFISTPSYCQFIFSIFNWIDLGAIVPYYVFLAIQLIDSNSNLDSSSILFVRILRILRFSRIFKIYMVFKRLKSLRVLSATIKESFIDFLVTVTILTILAFLFGAATYFAEQSENGDVFDSIPKAIYWGIITLTGVGYGDMCPITAVGRILTCFCAVSGSAAVGMLVSILVDRYQRVYNRKMYISEPEMTSADIDMNNSDDETKSGLSTGRRNLSAVFNHGLSTIQEMIRGDRNQSYKYQFVVSFNDMNRDRYATDQIVTAMKQKLAETIINTNIDIDLKLIDNDSKELWTISSSDGLTETSSRQSPYMRQTTHMFNIPQIKIETF